LLFFIARSSRHTIFSRYWSADVCSSGLGVVPCVADCRTPSRHSQLYRYPWWWLYRTGAITGPWFAAIAADQAYTKRLIFSGIGAAYEPAAAFGYFWYDDGRWRTKPRRIHDQKSKSPHG